MTSGSPPESPAAPVPHGRCACLCARAAQRRRPRLQAPPGCGGLMMPLALWAWRLQPAGPARPALPAPVPRRPGPAALHKAQAVRPPAATVSVAAAAARRQGRQWPRRPRQRSPGQGSPAGSPGRCRQDARRRRRLCLQLAPPRQRGPMGAAGAPAWAALCPGPAALRPPLGRGPAGLAPARAATRGLGAVRAGAQLAAATAGPAGGARTQTLLAMSGGATCGNGRRWQCVQVGW